MPSTKTARRAPSLLLRVGSERIVIFGVGRDGIVQRLTLRLGVVLPLLHGLVDHVDRLGPEGLHLLIRQVKRIIEGEWVAGNVADSQAPAGPAPYAGKGLPRGRPGRDLWSCGAWPIHGVHPSSTEGRKSFPCDEISDRDASRHEENREMNLSRTPADWSIEYNQEILRSKAAESRFPPISWPDAGHGRPSRCAPAWTIPGGKIMSTAQHTAVSLVAALSPQTWYNLGLGVVVMALLVAAITGLPGLARGS